MSGRCLRSSCTSLHDTPPGLLGHGPPLRTSAGGWRSSRCRLSCRGPLRWLSRCVPLPMGCCNCEVWARGWRRPRANELVIVDQAPASRRGLSQNDACRACKFAVPPAVSSIGPPLSRDGRQIDVAAPMSIGGRWSLSHPVVSTTPSIGIAVAAPRTRPDRQGCGQARGWALPGLLDRMDRKFHRMPPASRMPA